MEWNQQSEQGPVLTCQKDDCSYNRHTCCYAPQIQVGDEHPMCDTYTHDAVAAAGDMSAVGTCKVMECVFNGNADCHAPGITVGDHSGHADCLTMRNQ